jgi:hypothetical protein
LNGASLAEGVDHIQVTLNDVNVEEEVHTDE